MTEDQMTDFYMRWREWMVVATLRGAVIVANTKHTGVFKDLQERLLEDPWWKIRQIVPAPMLFKPEVPEDDMLFWTEGAGLQTPAELLGNKGFGRLTAKAPSKNGVSPWVAPEGYTPNIKPDSGGPQPELD